VRGDAVDEMLAGFLNKANLTIEVQRISASNYMFGTKKILAKIINGNLVIRVGGGYMNAEEFIEQYGKIEMIKLMKMEENKNIIDGLTDLASTTGPRSSMGAPRMSVRPGTAMTLGNDMKEKMRQTLLNVKTYETHNTNTDGTLQASYNKKPKGREMNVRSSMGDAGDLKSALLSMKSDYKKKHLTIQTENIKGGKHSQSPTHASSGYGMGGMSLPASAQTAKNNGGTKIGLG